MEPVLQQCDHCRLLQMSHRWPANDDGVFYCPRCGHDESAFVEVESPFPVNRAFRQLTKNNWRFEERAELSKLSYQGMGNLDIDYIRGLKR